MNEESKPESEATEEPEEREFSITGEVIVSVYASVMASSEEEARDLAAELGAWDWRNDGVDGDVTIVFVEDMG